MYFTVRGSLIKHGEDHKKETLEGLKRFMSEPLTVKYTERQVEGRKYPYRNVEEFPAILSPASKGGGGALQGDREVRPKKPASPAVPPPPLKEETVSNFELDTDVQLYRHCIKLSLLAWEPQFNEWKNMNQELKGVDLMKRIGETATSFYITKIKER